MHVMLEGSGDRRGRSGCQWEVTVALRGQLWTGLAGSVPSRGVTWRCWSQRPAELPSSLAVGIQVTLQTRRWHGIIASKLLVSCRRLVDPSPALGLLLASMTIAQGLSGAYLLALEAK